MRYSVGHWLRRPGQMDKWIVVKEFATAREAMRAARKLFNKLNYAWLKDYSQPYPDVSCVRIGGGTIFELEYRKPFGVGRQYYRQVGEMMAWADANN